MIEGGAWRKPWQPCATGWYPAAELNEAVRAVFCFGDDLPLRLIHEKLIVSERLGQVPEDAPMTPLQADLVRQQSTWRLPPEPRRAYWTGPAQT